VPEVANLAVALALLVSFGCSARQVAPPSLPKEIVVPSGATKINPESHRNGTTGVTYELNMRYPAMPLLEQIYKALPSPEWQPLKDDWLNPGTPSSHSRGWMNYSDGTRRPEAEVHSG
jgi:hypothetical protein